MRVVTPSAAAATLDGSSVQRFWGVLLRSPSCDLIVSRVVLTELSPAEVCLLLGPVSLPPLLACLRAVLQLGSVVVGTR